MMTEVDRAGLLEKRVAAKYRGKGFKVIAEPKPSDLPFDLQGYRPDFVITKPSGESYLIEVKDSATQMPIERYRDIAETVAKYPGWGFLLITGEDVEGDDKELLSLDQIAQSKIEAKKLLSSGQVGAAFLLAWRTFEAILRRQAVDAHLPIENFPTSSLINHLYSQGELSIEQFDKATALNTTRNLFVHGYQVANLADAANDLQALVDELSSTWFNS
jgi:hypothetical protein